MDRFDEGNLHADDSIEKGKPWPSTTVRSKTPCDICVVPVSRSETLNANNEHERYTMAQNIPSRKSASRSLFAKGDKELAKARAIYLKKLVMGTVLVVLDILVVFSLFWGSLWKVPAHQLHGWIVDFDGGDVGQFVVEGLRTGPVIPVVWEVVPSSRFPRGVEDLKAAVEDNGAWVAVVVNEGATARLQNSTSNPDPTYNGEDAITVYADEARNENAFRNLIRPNVQTSMYAIQRAFSVQYAANVSSNSNFTSIGATSPQTIVEPISYTLVNLVPFSQPVATAALSTGLIFVVIMSNFIVSIGSNARQASGISKLLSLRSLIALRLGTSFIAYFLLALVYALINLMFKLDLSHTYGHAGFVLFWITSWIYMLAVGLALESLLTVLNGYLSFFLTLWIVMNASTNSNPLEVLPKIFHYGYAMPFYNFSKAIRTIIFGTKNTLGLNIGVLLAWTIVSCMTLSMFQWYQQQQDIKAKLKAERTNVEELSVERKEEV